MQGESHAPACSPGRSPPTAPSLKRIWRGRGRRPAGRASGAHYPHTSVPKRYAAATLPVLASSRPFASIANAPAELCPAPAARPSAPHAPASAEPAALCVVGRCDIHMVTEHYASVANKARPAGSLAGTNQTCVPAAQPEQNS